MASGLHHPQHPHLALAKPDQAAMVWVEEKGDHLWNLKCRVVDFR